MSANSFYAFVPVGDMNVYELAEYAIEALMKLGWKIKPNDEESEAPAGERAYNGIPLKAEFWWTDDPASAARVKPQEATHLVICVQSISYQRAKKEVIDELRGQLAEAIEKRAQHV